MACNCMGQCPGCGRCHCMGCRCGQNTTFHHITNPPSHGHLSVNPTGWTCSACGKGNAPDVKGCVHCVGRLDAQGITGNTADPVVGEYTITSNVADERYRKIQIRRAGDMDTGR